MTERSIGAIDCWIEGCDWWVNEPADASLSGPERDDVRVAHMVQEHTVIAMSEEIVRRLRELGDPQARFTNEQVEDRRSIIYVLNKALAGTSSSP